MLGKKMTKVNRGRKINAAGAEGTLPRTMDYSRHAVSCTSLQGANGECIYIIVKFYFNNLRFC